VGLFFFLVFIWFGFFSLLHCERGGVILYLVSLFLGVFIWVGLVYKFLHCEREEIWGFIYLFSVCVEN
jgi:hypothetical protein